MEQRAIASYVEGILRVPYVEEPQRYPDVEQPQAKESKEAIENEHSTDICGLFQYLSTSILAHLPSPVSSNMDNQSHDTFI